MAATSTKIRRYGMITGLRPGKVNYYKETHAAVWPGVLEKIRDCNIQNYSIFLQQIEGEFYLFSYMEYTGNDYEADMQRMAEDPTTQLWWNEMNPCMLPLPEALTENNIWTEMDEVFHQD